MASISLSTSAAPSDAAISATAPTCGICYETVVSEHYACLIPCGHSQLCMRCVETWLGEQRRAVPTCPFCRGEVQFVETPAGRRVVDEFVPNLGDGYDETEMDSDMFYEYWTDEDDDDEYVSYDLAGHSGYPQPTLISRYSEGSVGFVLVDRSLDPRWDGAGEQNPTAPNSQRRDEWSSASQAEIRNSPASRMYEHNFRFLVDAAFETEGGVMLPRDGDVAVGQAEDRGRRDAFASGTVEEDGEAVREFSLSEALQDIYWELGVSER